MLPETTQQAPVEQPNPTENLPEVDPNISVAPGLDKELDAALSKTFPNITQNEPKTPEKVSEPEKPSEKPTEKQNKPAKAKEEPKVDPKSQTELPKPETLSDKTPKEQDGWTALKNNYKRAHKLVAERDQEIAKLKAGLAEKSQVTSKEVEDLRNQIKELSKYRTMVDIQADPEFISKYDEPINKAQESVKEMLKSMQVSEAIVDQINFSNTKLMDEIIGHVGEHRDKITARRLQRKIEEIVDLTEKRDETLSEQKVNYDKFMEDKKKESSMKGAEEEGRIVRHLENIAQAKGEDGNVAFPFLNKMNPPENATEVQIAQVNNHNAVVELMHKKLQEALASGATPEGRAEVAVAAVTSHYLQARLKHEIEKSNRLERELAKISNVSTEAETIKPRSTPRNGNGQLVDVDSALSTHFSR